MKDLNPGKLLLLFKYFQNYSISVVLYIIIYYIIVFYLNEGNFAQNNARSAQNTTSFYRICCNRPQTYF